MILNFEKIIKINFVVIFLLLLPLVLFAEEHKNIGFKKDVSQGLKQKFPMMLVKNKDKGFILLGKDTFIRLDRAGKQIEAKNYDYSLIQKFGILSHVIKPFKDGWLIEGWKDVMDKRHGVIVRQPALVRLLSDGQILWLQNFKNVDFAGSDGENIFFSREGTLYKCRERQSVTGK